MCSPVTVSNALLSTKATEGTITNKALVTYLNAGGGGRTMIVKKVSGSNTISGPSPNIYDLGGTTPVGGLWLGSDDKVTRSWLGLDTETYELEFDSSVTAVNVTFSAINGNTDGIEHIKIQNIFNGAGQDVTATTKYGFVDSTPATNGSLTFFSDTLTLAPTTYNPSATSGGTWGSANGMIMLQNIEGIKRIVFQRVEPGNSSSTNAKGKERSNGVGMGPIQYCNL
jgi:hypothetical protein